METESSKSAGEKVPSPVMDVVPPKNGKDEQESNRAHQTSASPKQKVAKPPRQPGSGVGLAIFATVVIVFGLAALMVYAYLRSQNIKPF